METRDGHKEQDAHRGTNTPTAGASDEQGRDGSECSLAAKAPEGEGSLNQGAWNRGTGRSLGTDGVSMNQG